MARKLDPMDLKQIIRLHLDGFSNRKLADTLSISRNTINHYINQFRASELKMEDILSLDEASIHELFPSKTTINNARYDRLMKYFQNANLASFHPGFTLKNHYPEYEKHDPEPYSYTQFVTHYRNKYKREKGSMKLNHLAGDKMFIDFAGKPLYIQNKETGEKEAVQVFVAILPCSQYTFVKACRTQKREDLLDCIASALVFFGGVPKAIVSDNLKSAVTRASKYEATINRALKQLANHYDCVINPTRTYAPQDKALVENAVYLSYQRIYYPLRNVTFFSLKSLNEAILNCLSSYNDMLFQLKEASRKELFKSIERTTLKPLPSSNFELVNHTRAKVQKIGYVYFSKDKSYYSVPYRYIGKYTTIQYKSDVVEVYYNHQRIALHQRNPSKGSYNTIKDHLSSTHNAYSKWSIDYFKKLAHPHGMNVVMFIEQLIGSASYPEIAYKRAMGVIQLHHKYGSHRLDNACQRALYGNALSYQRLKNILKHQLDKENLSLEQLDSSTHHIPSHQNIRGKSYYN